VPFPPKVIGSFSQQPERHRKAFQRYTRRAVCFPVQHRRSGVASVLLMAWTLGLACNLAPPTSAADPLPPSPGAHLQPVFYDILARYFPVSGQLLVECTLSVEAVIASGPCRLTLPSDLTALFEVDTGGRSWEMGQAAPGQQR